MEASSTSSEFHSNVLCVGGHIGASDCGIQCRSRLRCSHIGLIRRILCFIAELPSNNREACTIHEGIRSHMTYILLYCCRTNACSLMGGMCHNDGNRRQPPYRVQQFTMGGDGRASQPAADIWCTTRSADVPMCIGGDAWLTLNGSIDYLRRPQRTLVAAGWFSVCWIRPQMFYGQF